MNGGAGFRSELRMPCRAVAALLLVVCLTPKWVRGIDPFWASMAAAAAIALVLEAWNPLVGKWALVIALTGGIVASRADQGVVGALPLLSAPVAFAAAFLSLRAAAVNLCSRTSGAVQ